MKHLSLIIISIASLLLAACGGGGSSSNTSGEQFTGTQTITFAGNSEQTRFVMAVTESQVTILDEDFTASGARSGNRFSVTVPTFSVNDGGDRFDFNIQYTGTFESETRATGSLNGTVTWVNVNSTLPISGTFAANRGSAKIANQTLSQALIALAKQP